MKALGDSRILIVDDVKANVDVLVHALRDEYKLAVALDGESALRNAEKAVPDLVLLDIMMPGIDGYEVCRRLRASEATRRVPVMFLSALEDVANKTKGFEVGGNDYLTKPFEMLEVKARVRSLLRGQAVRRCRARGCRPRPAHRARDPDGHPAGRPRVEHARASARGRRGDRAGTTGGGRPLRGVACQRRSRRRGARRRVGEGHPGLALHGRGHHRPADTGARPHGSGRDPSPLERRTGGQEPARHVRDHPVSRVRFRGRPRVDCGRRSPRARDSLAGAGAAPRASLHRTACRAHAGQQHPVRVDRPCRRGTRSCCSRTA